MASSKPILKISSDEINCLIYAYLEDSGFNHSAYSLRNEARLDSSPSKDVPIPRGELITLLRKALLYVEVEKTWRKTPYQPTSSPITLLQQYQQATTDNDDNRDQQQQPNRPKSRASVIPVTGSSNLANSSSGSTSKKSGEGTSTRRSTGPTSEKRKNDNSDKPEREAKRARIEPTPAPVPVTVEYPPRKTATKSSKVIPMKDGEDPPPPEEIPPGSDTPISLAAKNDHYDQWANDRQFKGHQDPEPLALTSMKGHRGQVFVGAWNPVQKNVFASGEKNGKVIMWTQMPESKPEKPVWKCLTLVPPAAKPMTEAQRVRLGIEMTQDVTSVHWAPSGEYLAVAYHDFTVRVWNLKGQLLTNLEDHIAPNFGAKWSPDGKMIATASLDSRSICYDATSPPDFKVKQIFQNHDTESCCLDVEWLSPNTFSTCGTDKTIVISRVGKDAPLARFEYHWDEINQIKASKDRTMLASCSDDTLAIIWNVGKFGTWDGEAGWGDEEDGDGDGDVEMDSTAEGGSGGNGKGTSKKAQQKLKEEKRQKRRDAIKAKNKVPDSLITPLGRSLARNRHEGVIPSDIKQILRGHGGSVSVVQWSPGHCEDGYQYIVATASRKDRTARMWDIRTGACLKVFPGYNEDIFALEFDPWGRMLATGGLGRMGIYLVETGEAVWQAIHDNIYVSDIAWHQDGSLIAFTKENALVGILNVDILGIKKMLPPIDKPKPGETSLAPWQIAAAASGKR